MSWGWRGSWEGGWCGDLNRKGTLYLLVLAFICPEGLQEVLTVARRDANIRDLVHNVRVLHSMQVLRDQIH